MLLTMLVAACSRASPEARPDAAPPASALRSEPAARAVPPAPANSAPTPYPFDRTHSPIDANVARRLREIAARDPALSGSVFAKVGDSMTASDDFMRCFANPSLSLGDHADLSPLIERFRAKAAAGESAFRRRSVVSRIGWSAWQVLEGNPAPLEREIAAIRPRFALVQFGTNDLELGRMKHFALRLLDVTDTLIAHGVIPILFTMPLRKDRTDRAVWVPRYNAVVHVIAQGRQIPLVDYYRELAQLPGRGLGKDGIHPSTYQGPRGRDACALDREGLRHGYNLKNLLALRALERTERALSGDRKALDPVPAAAPSPPSIAVLPFADARRTAPSSPEEPAAECGAATAALDHELAYPLELTKLTALRATVFAGGGAETALAVRQRSAPRSCVSSGREAIVATLPPGSYDLLVAAKSRNTGSGAPEIFLTVLAE